jgi:hypothetical protein
MLGVQPLWGVMQASDWVATPCTVIASDIKVNPSADGLTTGIAIVYAYEFQGKTHQSDRYDFVTVFSNTNDAMKWDVVRANPPGKQTVCFVNPANPVEAVLQRGWTAEMLWGLAPVPFVLLGVVGLLRARSAW